MKHCSECGTELEEKYLENEGMVPYCPTCQQFRFPMFNVAVSMIVMNASKDQICLIKQYGRDSYILVAGYVNLGEDAEDAVAREIKEEMGFEVTEMSFNHSHYFAKSNTLMLNFTAVVKDMEAHPNEEIDSFYWFTIDDGRKNIRPNSLAQSFLNGYLDQEWHF